MGVKKYRSVEDIPGPPLGRQLDPENLRMAFGLAALAHGLAPVHYTPGVRKFRSWNEALQQRSAVRRPPRHNG